MRREGSAAKQTHCLTHFVCKAPLQLALFARGRVLGVDKDCRAESTIFNPEGIELGMTAHKHDRQLAPTCPAQHAAKSSGTAGKASRVKQNKVKMRLCTAR